MSLDAEGLSSSEGQAELCIRQSSQRDSAAGFEYGGRVPGQGVQAALQTGKGKELGSPLEPLGIDTALLMT